MRGKLQVVTVLVVLCVLAISGCRAVLAESTSGAVGLDEPVGTSEIALANPASVFCEENGGTLDIRADETGSIGFCVFADGGECEEWAYFREECQPGSADDSSELVYGWYGRVITPPAGQPFNYFLALSPKESGNAGLVSMNDEVGTSLAELCDSGRLAHFWGSLDCDVPGYGGCQVEVTRVRPEGPGEIFAPDSVDGWLGTLQSMPAGSQFDDMYVLSDPLFPVRYGIDAQDEMLAAQLVALRDTGLEVLVYGELTCGEMDVNGCQIRVSRIESDEAIVPAQLPEGASVVGVNDWVGQIKRTPDGAQFDDYFEKMGVDSDTYGIDAQDGALQQRIASLRDSGEQVHIWGRLVSDVPDYGTHQIVVTRLEVEDAPEAPEIVVEKVEDWVGIVDSAPEMAQVDDYFQMMDQNGTRAGIWAEGELGDRIEALRDTGTVIHIWGTIRYNVPDAYNAQITVTRMEVGE